MKRALVTAVLGDGYRRWYRRWFHDAQRAWARQLGVPLVVLDAPIPGPVQHPHPSWQKLALARAPELASFDRLAWVDADVFPLPGTPDPFAADAGWVGVDNNTHGDPEQARRDRRWYWFLPEESRPDRLLNTGLFVVDRAHLRVLLAVHDGYGGRWDQGPASHHFVHRRGTWASTDLNRIAVHTLVAEGFRAPRALVRRPGAVHFAAAGGAQLRGLLRWTAQRRRAELPALALLEVKRRIEGRVRPALRRGLAAAPASTSLRRWAPLERELARAAPERLLPTLLDERPRLLLSRHATAAPGWVAVDVADPEPDGLSPGKTADQRPAPLLGLPAAAVARLVGGRPLAAVRLEHVLAGEDDATALDLLRALAGAARGELVEAVEPAEGPDAAFAEAAALATVCPRGRLERLLSAAGLRGAFVPGPAPDGDFTLPRHHVRFRWDRS